MNQRVEHVSYVDFNGRTRTTGLERMHQDQEGVQSCDKEDDGAFIRWWDLIQYLYRTPHGAQPGSNSRRLTLENSMGIFTASVTFFLLASHC
jgi:hypothetical protein